MMKYFRNIASIIILLFAFSCIVLKAQDYNSNLRDQVVSSLNTAYEQSEDILFPSQFTKAVEDYNQARNYKVEGKPIGDITTELEKSKSWLDEITGEVSARAGVFADVLNARYSAKSAGAEKYNIEYWKNAEDKLKDAVNYYSDKDFEKVHSLLPSIIENYSKAKEYADYESHLLTQWEPLKNADNNLASLLSPSKYENGISKFNDALSAISKDKKMNSIRKSINESGTLFNQASEESEKFISAYPEVIKDRKEAEAAGAEIYSADFWNSGEQALSDAAGSFKDGESSDAVEYSLKAKQKYLDAKHLAISTKILSKVNKLVNKAEEENAEKYAPQSLLATKDLIKSIKGTINSGNYNSANLSDLTGKAEAKANLMMKIISAIKSVKDGSKTWEGLILGWNVFGNNENQQPDLNIVKKAMPAENKIPEMIPQIEQPTKLETTTNKPLSNVSGIPEQVYNAFSPGEAEIFDGGNEIEIRLTSVEYLKGISSITDKTKNLIDKAIGVFDYFPYTFLVVKVYSNDGTSHTSSQQLSQIRAEKILYYISLHKNIKLSRILATGYGQTGPITLGKNYKEYNTNCIVEIILKR